MIKIRITSLNYLPFLLIAIFSISLASCSGGYQWINMQPAEFQKISVQGELCTDGPILTTSKVKVMLIIDGSASLFMANGTDPDDLRIEGAKRLIDTYINDPNVSFAIVRFTAVGADLTGGFTRDLDLLNEKLNECANDYIETLEDGDPDTGIKEGIATAEQVIEADILSSENADVLANTLYTSVLFSDGAPWYDADNSSSGFWDRVDAVYDSVDNYMTLNDSGAMRVILNAAFLGNEENVYYGVPEPIFENVTGLMQGIALRGSGSYIRFSNAEDIDFLNIVSESMSNPYNFHNFTASNLNMQIVEINGETALNPDTDGDGLVDVYEKNEMLKFRERDSDGDLCGDGFETIYGSNPKITDCDCSEKSDSDGDGLLDCEENLIGTDINQPDSDGDFMPDGFEFYSTLNPLNAEDKYSDLDGDGEKNIWEFIFHTNPALFNDEFSDTYKYEYKIALNANTNTIENLYCYDVFISNISVLYTENEINNIQISTVQRIVDGASYKDVFSVGVLQVNIMDKLGSPEYPVYDLNEVNFTHF